MPNAVTLTASQFWLAYFQEDIVELERRPDGRYEGLLLDVGDGTTLLARDQPFNIGRADLAAFDTKPDARFIGGAVPRLSEALECLLRRGELREDTVEHARQLHLLLCVLREPSPSPLSGFQLVQTRQAIAQFHESGFAQSELIRRLKALVPGRDDTFGVLCGHVADTLAAGSLTAEQAAGILSAHEPVRGVPYGLLRTLLLRTVRQAEASLDRACNFLEALAPTALDYEKFESNGQLACLRAERVVLYRGLALCPTHPRVSAILLRTIQNHAHDDLFVIKTAIAALGRHNDKSAIDPLIAMLGDASMKAYREDLEKALQFLCSGHQMIVPSVRGLAKRTYTPEEIEAIDNDPGWEATMEQNYWSGVRQRLPANPAAWFQHDARSVFWEKRLRGALTAKQPNAAGAPLPAARLENDEVEVVRLAAGKGQSG